MNTFDYFYFEGNPIRCICGNGVREFVTRDLDNTETKFYLTEEGKFKVGNKEMKIDTTLHLSTKCDNCKRSVYVNLTFVKGILTNQQITFRG